MARRFANSTFRSDSTSSYGFPATFEMLSRHTSAIFSIHDIEPIAFFLCERRTRLSKYDALTEFLNRKLADCVPLLFNDIEDEDKIGVQLPKAAREHAAWWANEANAKTRHYQCRAWTEVGWKVESVDFTKVLVVFVRFRN